MLNTYRMVVAVFLVKKRANWVRIFKETSFVASVSLEVVFRMSFLILSGADVDFSGRELWWKTYITEKALPTTKRIELMGKKEFAAAALDLEHATYILHIKSVSFDTSPSSFPLNVYPFRRPQISGLIAEKAPPKVLAKYSNFADVFSLDLASKLSEHTRINDHAIELIDGQQPLYGPIYSLGPVELETLKAYIQTNLANKFIRLSKSPTSTPILFEQKSNGFFQLCVDYWGFNNLTIKNCYPLPLIGELLNRLKRAKCFIQLDLTSAYHRKIIRKGDK